MRQTSRQGKTRSVTFGLRKHYRLDTLYLMTSREVLLAHQDRLPTRSLGLAPRLLTPRIAPRPRTRTC
jgi:hypothetical protein